MTDNHDWKLMERQFKGTDCVSDGYMANVFCTKCGTALHWTKLSQHTWDDGIITKKATCTGGGIKTYRCTVCGTEKTESVETTGHVFGNWKTVSAATVFSAEEQMRSCSICNTTEKRNVGSKLTPTITLNTTAVSLEMKQSADPFTVTGLAKGDSVKSWKSSDTSIVVVDNDGKLTAQNKTGKATVTVTLGSGLEKPITVTVQNKNTKTASISGVPSKATIQIGKTMSLKPVITPATSLEKIVYKSLNSSIASVNSKGVITAKKPGTTKITVTSGKKKVTVTVTVPKILTKKITNVPSSLAIKKGKSVTLKPILAPKNSTDKITFTSSDKKVATVDSKGKIKGKKTGTVVITVKSGKVTVKCKVRVK